MSFWNAEAVATSLRRAVEAPPDDALALTQAITWVALCVRQHADGGRLSPELQRRPWPVRLHWPTHGAALRSGDAANFGSFYELRASRASALTTMRLCGMVIHSLVLAPVLCDDGRPAGFFVTSMLARDEGLFFLEWRRLAELVDRVCDETVGSGVMHGS